MDSTTHSARITEPVRYVAMNGRNHKIPVGPCWVFRGNWRVAPRVGFVKRWSTHRHELLMRAS